MIGGDNELFVLKVVIDWFCGWVNGYMIFDGDEMVEVYWCMGKVGMIGILYNGMILFVVVIMGVEGLEVIILIVFNILYYYYYCLNGFVCYLGGWMGEDIDVLYDFINSGDFEKRKYCDCEICEEIFCVGFD